jgi:HEAT repeats
MTSDSPGSTLRDRAETHGKTNPSLQESGTMVTAQMVTAAARNRSMNSTLIAIIGGAAAVAATLSLILFGKPKPESRPSLPTTSAPPSNPSTTGPDADSQARSAPTNTPIDPTERARMATAAASGPATAVPMQAATHPQTFVPIQDPKRPSTPELEDLSQKILAWGDSHQLANVAPILTNVDHSDPLIRTYVAVALGKISQGHSPADLAAVITALGKLSQDKHPAVRNAAIKALSSIQSAAVLPYLERSLANTTGNTQQTASAAIARLKSPAVGQ